MKAAMEQNQQQSSLFNCCALNVDKSFPTAVEIISDVYYGCNADVTVAVMSAMYQVGSAMTVAVVAV